ncbi:MAG: hypothetical protein H0X17_14100 [Deltaproteobacteria bacterium]|nr:hypothetical protein [Deltaproteobacteria bacterium]
MRKTGICPKCSHNGILVVGAVPDIGRNDFDIQEMYLAIVFTGTGFFGDDKLARQGKLSAVVCQSCGFTELYVVDPASIRPDGTYVRELTGPAATAPFR